MYLQPILFQANRSSAYSDNPKVLPVAVLTPADQDRLAKSLSAHQQQVEAADQVDLQREVQRAARDRQLATGSVEDFLKLDFGAGVTAKKAVLLVAACIDTALLEPDVNKYRRRLGRKAPSRSTDKVVTRLISERLVLENQQVNMKDAVRAMKASGLIAQGQITARFEEAVRLALAESPQKTLHQFAEEVQTANRHLMLDRVLTKDHGHGMTGRLALLILLKAQAALSPAGGEITWDKFVAFVHENHLLTEGQKTVLAHSLIHALRNLKLLHLRQSGKWDGHRIESFRLLPAGIEEAKKHFSTQP